MSPDFIKDFYPRKRESHVKATMETCAACGELAPHRITVVETQEGADEEWKGQQLHKECTKCWKLSTCRPEDYDERVERADRGESMEEILADPIATDDPTKDGSGQGSISDRQYNVATGAFASLLASEAKYNRRDQEWIWILLVIALLGGAAGTWYQISRTSWPGSIVAGVAIFVLVRRLTAYHMVKSEFVHRIRNFAEKMRIGVAEVEEALKRTSGRRRILPYLDFQPSRIALRTRIAVPLVFAVLGILYAFAERPVRAEIDWHRACEENTVEAYEEYSMTYFRSPHEAEARRRAEELENAREEGDPAEQARENGD